MEFPDVQSGIGLPTLTEVEFPEVDEQQPNQSVQGEQEDTAAAEEESEDTESAEYRDIPGEVAANIHKKEFDDFWSQKLKPDLWTARVRAEGYKLSFIDGKWPEEYQEPNNKSALDNADFAWEQLMDWNRKGVVDIVEKKPHCVSPLTVSLRTLTPEDIKKRLCLDLSRHINKLIKKETVKLASLDKALEILLPLDFQAAYDLASAYHHVSIHPDYRTLLGCSLRHPQTGKEVFFVFKCMPFGLSTATHVLTRMTKPICVYITRNGIRHTIFIDDGKVNAADKETLQWAFGFVLDTLRKAGFVISEKKTDTVESMKQQKLYLGFEIDSVTMTVRATKEKITQVKLGLRQILQRKRTDAKKLAQIVGKVIALEPAIGPTAQLLTRSAYMDIAQAVDKFGWKARLEISEQTKDCFAELLDCLDEFNGTTIKSAATAVPLRAILDDCHSEATIHGWKYQEKEQIVAGDASDKAVCAYGVRDLPDLFLQARLSSRESELSSGHRELLTVKKTLQAKQTLLKSLPSKNILWLTDSTNMVAFLSKGSTKPHILKDILDTFREARKLDLRITPIHVSREDYRIQEADHGTRYFDPDDWAVDQITYEKLTSDRRWHPTVDLFAHPTNAKTERFFSYGKAPRSAGVDAFAQSWDKETAWTCPPTSLIIQAMQKIGATDMKAILVVPAWPTAIFWTFLFPDGERAQEMVEAAELVQPFIIRGQFCDNKLLQGRTSFPFLVMYIRSKGRGYRHRSGKVEDPMKNIRKN